MAEVQAAAGQRSGTALRARGAVASLWCGVAGLLATALGWVLSFTTALDALAVREVLGVVTMLLVLLAPPVAVVLGALGVRSARRTMAIAGLVLGAASLAGIVAALAVAG